MRPFLDALADGAVLFDGAMGTLLYDRGVLHTRSYDELVLSQPELIRRVHADYLAAGAQVLTTDTFGANRIALARHGLADQMVEINKAAVKLAPEVAAGRAWVAGAVGPTGVRFAIASEAERRRARMALAEQIDTLVIAGVDVILLETFPSILELETAIAVAKQRGPRVPVIAQHVFDIHGKGDGGLAPAEVAERLIAAGADAIGANCGAGPAELYAVGTAMVGRGKPVVIQPNAGMPTSVEGRTIYVANPEHFGVFARRMLKSGIRAIGGCCGTTPEHIRTMLGAVRMMGGVRIEQLDAQQPRPDGGVPDLHTVPTAAVPLAARSRLGGRIARGEFAVSVELTAPAGTDLTKTRAQVDHLLAHGVDVVNIADGPRASARMANLAVCSRMLTETGVEPILHVCSRDRNFLGLVAHLLGAAALGLRDLVIITGDPPKMGDYPFATPVYDVDSIGLLKIARGLNAGFDPAGKPTGTPTAFVLATGAEPGAQDYDRELRRLEDKKAAGAELVMTQPVYDPRTLERFLDDTRGFGLPTMVGILPLASSRNAEFLHNEVPGMSIPAEIRARMAKAPPGPEARAEGLRIAQEALAAVKHRVAGAYVMPPFNRVEAAVAVLEAAADRWQPAPRPTPGAPT